MDAEAKARREKRLSGGKLTPKQLEEMKPYEREQAEKASADIITHMAAPGSLGLPELLERRRQEYGLPDHLFDAQASFGFVLVYQITRLASDTYGDSRIVRTEANQDREAKEAPRGIVVAAGLEALDKLRSHGMDLGHIVMFSRSVPYRASMGFAGLKEQRLIVLQAGDIFASEDTATMLLNGELRLGKSEDTETGFVYHYYTDADGHVWKPQSVKKTASV